jgi:hypothetical protein
MDATVGDESSSVVPAPQAEDRSSEPLSVPEPAEPMPVNKARRPTTAEYDCLEIATVSSDDDDDGGGAKARGRGEEDSSSRLSPCFRLANIPTPNPGPPELAFDSVVEVVHCDCVFVLVG